MKRRIFVGILIVLLFASSLASAKEIVLACVDCFSSGSLIPQSAAAIAPDVDIKWIVIKTYKYATEAQEKSLSAFPSNHTKIITVNPENQNEVDSLLSLFRRENVTKILGGTDEGSFHASEWNHRLGIPDNDPGLRNLRRKKFAQSQAVGEYGIPTLLLSDEKEALRFIAEQVADDQRVVFKLNNGVAGVGLQIVAKSEAPKLIRKYASGVTGAQGEADRYVIQPEIDGSEYYVQTYSFNGKTYITGLWLYHKITFGNSRIYFVDRPLSLTSATALELQPVVSSINTSLGNRNGPAHIEIKKETRTGLWKLIENNVRIAGSGIPAVEHRIYSLSQLDLWLLSVLKPEKLEEMLETFPRPMIEDAFIFVIPSPFAGQINGKGLQEIYNLKTSFFPADHYRVKPGKAVKGPTQDLNSAAFVLHAVGSTQNLKRDFKSALATLTSHKLINPAFDFPVNCQQAMALANDFYAKLKVAAEKIPW